MAIQIPNPETGNGATGDNEFVLWSKVKDNFSDTTHAASKLVGAGVGQLTLNENLFKNTFGSVSQLAVSTDLNTLLSGRATFQVSRVVNAMPAAWTSTFSVLESHSTTNGACQVAYATEKSEINYRATLDGLTWSPWARFYSTGNTTKDANGFIKAASPIVKVFADKVELNTDAESQNVSYKKNGIGDYTITTVSGLSTDGWYIELPKDMNGNPKVAVTLSEADGVISLKTYKRIFSMETFTFEPDLDNPLDIPDTRWIDLRLNEIPVEAQEELPTDGD